MPGVNVLKLNLDGVETWRYPAEILTQSADRVVIQAYFNRADLPFHGILLGQGDRFVEIYFTERWYNIFEIHAREDDHLRGYYCNVARPALVTPEAISFVDLALDLLVYPDGRQLVLDEDEFDALPIAPAERAQARSALAELQAGFTNKTFPPKIE
jgi:uncharacterized protein